jgi:hypothetical protein
MTVKAHQFDHIVNKFQMKSRNAGDRLVWFKYEGKLVTYTRRSHKSGDLPFQKSMPKQLGLTPNEFRQAAACKLDRDEYIKILRRKGYLK